MRELLDPPLPPLPPQHSLPILLPGILLSGILLPGLRPVWPTSNLLTKMPNGKCQLHFQMANGNSISNAKLRFKTLNQIVKPNWQTKMPNQNAKPSGSRGRG